MTIFTLSVTKCRCRQLLQDLHCKTFRLLAQQWLLITARWNLCHNKSWWNIAQAWRNSVKARRRAAAISVKGKGKGFRAYSLPSVGPGADHGVQAVSPQVTVSHPPGGRLSLLSAMPAFTFPAAEHHRSLVSTKLYCLVTAAHRCEQLAQGCYTALL